MLERECPLSTLCGHSLIADIRDPAKLRHMSQSVTYGPDKALLGLWALLVSPPAFIFGYLLAKSPTAELARVFLVTLAFPALPILFALRFRATFTPTEFEYRRWGSTIRVPYDDIQRIDVTNATPLGRNPVRAFIVTKRGTRLPFWHLLFPQEAVTRFFSLAP